MPATKEWLTGLLQRLRNALFGGSRLAQRVAVLIDGDGTSPQHADLVFTYARSLGQISSAQLHANFAALAPKAWSEPIRAHGITAVQHFRGKGGGTVLTSRSSSVPSSSFTGVKPTSLSSSPPTVTSAPLHTSSASLEPGCTAWAGPTLQ